MELELDMSIILIFNKFESDMWLLVAIHAAKSLAKWHNVDLHLLEWCSAKARHWEQKFVGIGNDLCTTVKVGGTLLYYFHNIQYDWFRAWE